MLSSDMISKKTLSLHKKYNGKISIASKIPNLENPHASCTGTFTDIKSK